MNDDDDDVVTRAKQGDPDAWRELYEAHAGRLVVWLKTEPTGDAIAEPDDVAADAWLTAANKVNSFHGNMDGFAGWLFGIARNHARNARRRTVRRATDSASLEETLVLADRISPNAGYEHLDWVRSVLAYLSPREREIVSCLDVVGLSVAETCAALGMSKVAVRVTHHRALARLRSSKALLTTIQ